VRKLRTLASTDDGAAIVEFALIAPVMLMTLMGLFDLGHGVYTRAMLLGAIEKAARDSTIETATTGALDAKVTEVVQSMQPGATLSFTRKSYASFSDVSVPEDWTDSNGNSTCDAGEPFEDANGNGVWDTDRGINGLGGARDAVLYRVTVQYPRLFPVYKFIPGQSNTMTLQAISILRNQPYALQGTVTATGNCP
jgi:Flp pilus assembly protein TadG